MEWMHTFFGFPYMLTLDMTGMVFLVFFVLFVVLSIIGMVLMFGVEAIIKAYRALRKRWLGGYE